MLGTSVVVVYLPRTKSQALVMFFNRNVSIITQPFTSEFGKLSCGTFVNVRLRIVENAVLIFLGSTSYYVVNNPFFHKILLFTF